MARSMLVLAFLSVASAFAPVARHAAVRASTSVAMAPVEIAQSLDVVSQLPTELVSLEARRRVPGTAGEGRGSAARARAGGDAPPGRDWGRADRIRRRKHIR